MRKEINNILHTLSIMLAFMLSTDRLKAQEVDIEREHDILSYQWIYISNEMKTYDGLANYCKQPKYRHYTSEVLESIHYYDSIVLDMIKYPRPEIALNQKELKRVVKDITQFGIDYDPLSVVSYLEESCDFRKQLERDKKELKKRFGAHSYNARLLVFETGLTRYLRGMDKRILEINDYIFDIGPELIIPTKYLADKYVIVGGE